MGKIDILKIAKQAQIDKMNNPLVVDATIGMFYDDNRQLVIPDVKEAFFNLDINETFRYGSTDGGPLFEHNVIDWVLDEKKEKIQSKFLTKAIATPGGSGALSLIFNTYGEKGDKVLLPDLRWRYEYFLNSAGLDIEEYSLFDDRGFNLIGFKEKLSLLCKNQKRVIVIINDPCHNPTGYQLTDEEWVRIIGILNSFKDNQIILTYDLAYFDYDPKGFTKARNSFDHLYNLENHVETLITFSASKSLAIYGVRLGALIGMYHNEEQLKFFKSNVLEDALGKWSTAPSVGISIFNEVSKDKSKFKESLIKLQETLKKRGDIFIKEANESLLEYYPYSGGFFILLKSNDPESDFKKLVENNIYVIPMEKGLRLALCSITTEETKSLASKIKSILK